jgi:hypothetical protein
VKPIIALAVSLAVVGVSAPAQQKNIPDVSKIRGFNYQSAPAIGHAENWIMYDPAETERDMDYAKRLNLNQVRVLIPYAAYVRDKVAFRKNLLHFVRACHQRGIGVMVTPMWPRNETPTASPLSREWAADLVSTVGNGKEPGLAFWDAHNEPAEQRFEFAKHMASVFHELDKRTPVVIGARTETHMEAIGSDAVDVLCFHDYSGNRAQVREAIDKAKQFAAKAGKPVMNTEFGCVGRANPYDMALEEYMKAGMAWYIWELMITNQWGTVHGIVYADGAVRDPSIVAALFGFFRERGPDVMPEVPDREGRLTNLLTDTRKWLDDPAPAWALGLDLAEREANFLEAAQLTGLHDLPTRQVDLLRRLREPDVPALRALVQKYAGILQPYEVPLGDPQRGRTPGWIR